MSILTDARALVTGFGSVVVQYGGLTTRGLLDDEDTPIALGDGTALLTAGKQLLVAADTLVGLRAEDTLTIGSLASDVDVTSYRVVDVRKQADGVLLQVRVVA